MRCSLIAIPKSRVPEVPDAYRHLGAMLWAGRLLGANDLKQFPACDKLVASHVFAYVSGGFDGLSDHDEAQEAAELFPGLGFYRVPEIKTNA
jgi:hypothetical protein